LKVRGFSPRIFERVITWVSLGHGVFTSGNPGSPRVILLDFGVPMTREILDSPRGRPGPRGTIFEFSRFSFFSLFSFFSGAPRTTKAVAIIMF